MMRKLRFGVSILADDDEELGIVQAIDAGILAYLTYAPNYYTPN
jgi:hypothetical protein